MNYTLQEIARITGGKLIGEDRKVDGVLTDSRTGIDSSSPLFVALAGKSRDGHEYLKEMYRRGVRSFLVSQSETSSNRPDSSFIVVNDTLHALQQWAAFHRGQFGGVVVGITGSNGKTIVKEWIAQLAPAGKKMFRSPRSYNSQIGVPLSLLMINGDEEVAVIEAGISQPGEMSKLEDIIRPNVIIITNIGPPHQENFTNTAEKLNEKLILARRAEKIIYPAEGSFPERYLREKYPDKELIPAISPDDIEIPFADQISIGNARLATTFWQLLGVSPKEMLPKLKNLQPVAMRMELQEGFGGAMIINDSYNADVNSLSAALDTLKSVAGERQKVVILSDIFQTGMGDQELYKEVARLTASAHVDLLIGIGERISACANLFTGAKAFYPATRDFIGRMNRSEFSDKAILIKGSRSFRFERISRMLEKQVHTTVLEVDLDAMIHNLNVYRSKLGAHTRIMAMVKAFSYGSGSFEVAAMLQHQGVAYLAVAFTDEGVQLREAGITMPIVVLNADSGSFGAMIDYRLEPEIYSFSSLEKFSEELNRRGEQHYPVHVSFDTGMHRLGFMPEETEMLIGALKNRPEIYVRSAFTHFAVSDEPGQDHFTREQINVFLRAGENLRKAFPEWKIWLHAANSAGIERFPEGRLDMVRLGLGLYGVSSFEPGLKPVGTLKSRIVQIKHLKPGETVGYGRHGKIERDSVIATIPVGYADGLDRRLGKGAWNFILNGQSAPTIGNICMDTCMIDISGIQAKEGDEVIIFGEEHGVEEMAKALGTIPYEILTSVSSRVKRIFVKES